MTAPPPPGPTRPTGPPTPPVDTTKAVLAHAGGIVVGFLAPLLIYLLAEDDPYAREHAKEALNFHISFYIYAAVSAVLILVLVGILLLIALSIAFVVLQIMGAVAASKWQMYRYPLTIRFLQ